MTRATEGFDPPKPDDPKFSITARRGFRAWYAQKDGHLKSLSYSYLWLPVWNRCACLASTTRLVNPNACAGLHHPDKRYSHTDECERRPPCEHPSLGCTCGFYAYHGPDHWSAPDGAVVTGVIEAMGRLVIGKKGFRAEKALIVALRLPRDDELANAVAHRYPTAAHFTDEQTMLARVPLTAPPDTRSADDPTRFDS